MLLQKQMKIELSSHQMNRLAQAIEQKSGVSRLYLGFLCNRCDVPRPPPEWFSVIENCISSYNYYMSTSMEQCLMDT